MDKKTALKTLGTIAAIEQTSEPLIAVSESIISYDFFLEESRINNIVIKKESGEELRIPFKETIDALEEE